MNIFNPNEDENVYIAYRNITRYLYNIRALIFLGKFYIVSDAGNIENSYFYKTLWGPDFPNRIEYSNATMSSRCKLALNDLRSPIANSLW